MEYSIFRHEPKKHVRVKKIALPAGRNLYSEKCRVEYSDFLKRKNLDGIETKHDIADKLNNNSEFNEKNATESGDGSDDAVQEDHSRNTSDDPTSDPAVGVEKDATSSLHYCGPYCHQTHRGHVAYKMHDRSHRRSVSTQKYRSMNIHNQRIGGTGSNIRRFTSSSFYASQQYRQQGRFNKNKRIKQQQPASNNDNFQFFNNRDLTRDGPLSERFTSSHSQIQSNRFAPQEFYNSNRTHFGRSKRMSMGFGLYGAPASPTRSDFNASESTSAASQTTSMMAAAKLGAELPSCVSNKKIKPDYKSKSLNQSLAKDLNFGEGLPIECLEGRHKISKKEKRAFHTTLRQNFWKESTKASWKEEETQFQIQQEEEFIQIHPEEAAETQLFLYDPEFGTEV